MENIRPSSEHQRVTSQSATVLSELLISDGFILRGIKKMDWCCCGGLAAWKMDGLWWIDCIVGTNKMRAKVLFRGAAFQP